MKLLKFLVSISSNCHFWTKYLYGIPHTSYINTIKHQYYNCLLTARMNIQPSDVDQDSFDGSDDSRECLQSLIQSCLCANNNSNQGRLMSQHKPTMFPGECVVLQFKQLIDHRFQTKQKRRIRNGCDGLGISTRSFVEA